MLYHYPVSTPVPTRMSVSKLMIYRLHLKCVAFKMCRIADFFKFCYMWVFLSPPCSNRPAFVFMCHTLQFCAISFSAIGFLHVAMGRPLSSYMCHTLQFSSIFSVILSSCPLAISFLGLPPRLFSYLPLPLPLHYI